MSEKLIYFKLNKYNKNILLYTFNEAYNGMDNYLKIYAVEFDQNNLAILDNMSDEIHQEVRKSIALIGKEQDNDEITILPFPEINVDHINGKAFAIPVVFKNTIQKLVEDKLRSSELKKTDDILELEQTSNHVEPTEEKSDELLSALEQENVLKSETNNLETQNEGVYFQEPHEVNASAQNEQNISDTSNKENDSQANYNQNDLFMNISGDLERENNDKPLMGKELNQVTNVNENENENASKEIQLTSLPTLDEVENAIETIKKYIEHIKVNNGKLSNETKESSALSTEQPLMEKIDKPINGESISSDETPYFSNNDIINESIFPYDDVESQSSPINQEQNDNYKYGDTQNELFIPEINVSVPESNEVVGNEPVVMPANFVGKQEPNFEVTGLGPSTLSTQDSEIKNVA